MQPLFQLRQGAQLGHQGRGHRPQLGPIDLTPQPPGGSQGGGQLQQRLTGGGAPLGAELHGAGDIGYPLKTQPPLGEAIEGQQLAGFRLQGLAIGLAIGQGKGDTAPPAGSGAGETGHVA